MPLRYHNKNLGRHPHNISIPMGRRKGLQSSMETQAFGIVSILLAESSEKVSKSKTSLSMAAAPDFVTKVHDIGMK